LQGKLVEIPKKKEFSSRKVLLSLSLFALAFLEAYPAAPNFPALDDSIPERAKCFPHFE